MCMSCVHGSQGIRTKRATSSSTSIFSGSSRLFVALIQIRREWKRMPKHRIYKLHAFLHQHRHRSKAAGDAEARASMAASNACRTRDARACTCGGHSTDQARCAAQADTWGIDSCRGNVVLAPWYVMSLGCTRKRPLVRCVTAENCRTRTETCCCSRFDEVAGGSAHCVGFELCVGGAKWIYWFSGDARCSYVRGARIKTLAQHSRIVETYTSL